jgi:hypothetical protein
MKTVAQSHSANTVSPARKEAMKEGEGENEHENPDLNAGHVQESSRPGMAGKSGGWDKHAKRKIVVNPIESENPGPVIEPHGIKRV